MSPKPVPADTAGVSVLFFVALLAAATVREGGASLRSGGCDMDAPVKAKLAAGTAVEVRSSIAGSGGVCYRVAVVVDGAEVTGNLPATVLDGLEEFDQARRSASAGGEGVVQMVDGLRRALAAPGSSNVALEASALLDRNEPGRALELLTPHTASGNADVLLLAGVAAWKSDRVPLALQHWKAAQAMRPDPGVAAMIVRVEKEIAHDRSGERASGLRVTLRYEGEALPYASAKAMVDTLDAEAGRLSGLLGCTYAEKLAVIVQSPEAYRNGSNAAEWSAGQFDGSRIRVPVDRGSAMDANMRMTLTHEMVHACLSSLGKFPAWLHEGLAQKLSGERLSPAMRGSIRELAATRQLPKLENFKQDWSRISAQHARIAYAVALAAADELMDGYGSSVGLRTVLTNPAILATATKDLNQRLGIVE